MRIHAHLPGPFSVSGRIPDGSRAAGNITRAILSADQPVPTTPANRRLNAVVILGVVAAVVLVMVAMSGALGSLLAGLGALALAVGLIYGAMKLLVAVLGLFSHPSARNETPENPAAYSDRR
jgi:hypothetical protein